MCEVSRRWIDKFDIFPCSSDILWPDKHQTHPRCVTFRRTGDETVDKELLLCRKLLFVDSMQFNILEVVFSIIYYLSQFSPYLLPKVTKTFLKHPLDLLGFLIVFTKMFDRYILVWKRKIGLLAQTSHKKVTCLDHKE